MGFVAKTDGSFDSVSWTNFKFEEWGDDGTPPTELQFDFKAGCLIPALYYISLMLILLH